MWIEKIRLPVVSASYTAWALARMTPCQSCPQLGASTMIVWVNPAARSFFTAAVVGAVQPAGSVLPQGSLPMLTMT